MEPVEHALNPDIFKEGILWISQMAPVVGQYLVQINERGHITLEPFSGPAEMPTMMYV
jgi:hypothetical protein